MNLTGPWYGQVVTWEVGRRGTQDSREQGLTVTFRCEVREFQAEHPGLSSRSVADYYGVRVSLIHKANKPRKRPTRSKRYDHDARPSQRAVAV